MANIDLYLYRLKLVFPIQKSLFSDDLSRPDLFRSILNERPSFELRRGLLWHIGNVTFIDENGGYFAVGRTTRSTLEKYDEKTKNFTEEELETSPYTHVLFDCRIGFLAIANKARLSPTIQGIARKICDLFSTAPITKTNELHVSLDQISDPLDFIESVRSAYSIRRFEVTFSRSNPFDVDEFFQKPMEKYLDATNGEKGKTAVTGQDLNSETLIIVTQSVAATGNDAKAILKIDEHSRYSTKWLHRNPAHFRLKEEEFSFEEALKVARKVYNQVRGNQDELEDY